MGFNFGYINGVYAFGVRYLVHYVEDIAVGDEAPRFTWFGFLVGGSREPLGGSDASKVVDADMSGSRCCHPANITKALNALGGASKPRIGKVGAYSIVLDIVLGKAFLKLRKWLLIQLAARVPSTNSSEDVIVLGRVEHRSIGEGINVVGSSQVTSVRHGRHAGARRVLL